MNRLMTAGLVACLAAIATAPLSAAQSPGPRTSPGPTLQSSPGPDLQRVELPETGFAVSFPTAWTIDVRTVPLSAESILPGPDTEAAVLVNAYVPDTLHGCRVSHWREVDMTPAELARWQADLTRSDLAVEPTLLPAGEALHYALIEDGLTEPDVEVFVLGLGDDVLQLTCLAADPPDDRWLSIAETLELLPVEE